MSTGIELLNKRRNQESQRSDTRIQKTGVDYMRFRGRGSRNSLSYHFWRGNNFPIWDINSRERIADKHHWLPANPAGKKNLDINP
jgi:hypothetical protein